MATVKTYFLITFAVTAFLCSAFAPTFAASSGRHLAQAPPPLEVCSASPGSQIPTECSGTFSGNQWDKDELECHGEQGYQLKCDHNQEILGSNTVRCNIDGGPLTSEIEFEGNVDGNCQVSCDWADVQGKLPGDVYPTIQRILTAWKPQEDLLPSSSGTVVFGRNVCAAVTVVAAAAMA